MKLEDISKSFYQGRYDDRMMFWSAFNYGIEFARNIHTDPKDLPRENYKVQVALEDEDDWLDACLTQVNFDPVWKVFKDDQPIMVKPSKVIAWKELEYDLFGENRSKIYEW